MTHSFTISEMKSVIIDAYHAKNPIFIIGPSGSGKSDGVRQVVEHLAEVYGQFGLVDLRLSQLSELDLRGIPYKDENGKTAYAIPDELPQVERDGERGILFLDEITSAPPQVEASGYQLVLDRKLGAYTLPDGWLVVAAGNRLSDKGVTYEMPAPLGNRFQHCEVEVSHQELIKWGTDTGRINPVICAYLSFRPEYTHDFDPDRESLAWASPRTWEMLSRSYDRLETKSASMRRKIVAGHVGEHVASDFLGFVDRLSELEKVEDILASPDTAKIPDDASGLFAIVGAIQMVVANSHNPQPEHMGAVVTYAARMPKSYGVTLVYGCIHRSQECNETEAATRWKIENANVC